MSLPEESKKIDLVLISFLILFLELALIRWIPAQIRYLSYFTNIILMSSFLGIGLGCINSRRKTNLLSFFPFLLLFIILFVNVFRLQLNFPTEQVLFLWSSWQNQTTEPFILLPLVFLITVALFITLGQTLGKLLTQFQPLTAYSLDITGSILGIFVFSLISFGGGGPTVWFGIIAILFLYFERSSKLKFLYLFTFILILIYLGTTDKKNFWSPYYRINLVKLSSTGWAIDVNSITHQVAETFDQMPQLYKIPYEQFAEGNFAKVLIVGAGVGSDATVALRNKAKEIDAVEIDPTILEIGKIYHPDFPYNDPRVNLITTDGREFLQNTPKKYDLILFALTDSLVLTSSFSNLRLESYLYTSEAFRLAKRHLNSNGVFALYSLYRKEWLVDKLAKMISLEFPQEQIWVKKLGQGAQAAVIMAGPGILNIPQENLSPWIMGNDQNFNIATDNWPFVYLKEHSFPRIYLKALLVIFLLALGLFWTSLNFGKNLKRITRLDFGFFFMGGAFMLLEAKSVINFNLLFGSTWLVNSLVFVGILLNVLLANIIIAKTNLGNKLVPVFFLFLFTSLLTNFLMELQWFLNLPKIPRYILASAVLFSPIFFANLIFSSLFKKVKKVNLSFAFNLCGAFLGGFFEYLSMLLGYKNLLIIISLFYFLAFSFTKNSARTLLTKGKNL